MIEIRKKKDNNNSPLKILVITMYCGESQFERCVQSVITQTKVICDHKIIENKPNVQAHRELYETINSMKNNYDYFVKLDADMEFSSPEALTKMLFFFDSNTDHLTIPVFDFIVGGDLGAFNIFSNRVFIDTSKMDNLYVDKVKLTYPGKRIDIKESHKFVYHCCNPTDEQCIAFGIHRAFKIRQTDRLIPNIRSSKNHYTDLCRAYKNWITMEHDNQIYYALVAASLTLSGKISGIMSNKSTYMNSNLIKKGNKELVEKWFKSPNLLKLIKAMGIFRFLSGFLFWLVEKAKRILILR